MAPVTEHASGKIEWLGPLVRRLLAPNPSPFTFTGTHTYLVGRGEVAVIDPGPDLPQHVEALIAGLVGERATAIICTHTHRDHSPASRSLAAATGAPIIGCAPLPQDSTAISGEDAFDIDYSPHRILGDGERLRGPGWTLEAIATPGHTSNHLCFALPEARALFTGDHVMGWSTSVVAPPDGSMTAYMRSLAKLQSRDDSIYYPAHGPPVDNPQKLLRGLILHRRQREAQIIARLDAGEGQVPGLVAAMYKDLDPGLRPAAAQSVLAHLLNLEARGIVRRNGDDWQRVDRGEPS
jgi:glyoxylase-like metal-dependent hydrolase (beta-lactamase superfamily II)